MKLTRKKVWFSTVCLVILSTAIFAATRDSEMKKEATDRMNTEKLKAEETAAEKMDTATTEAEKMAAEKMDASHMHAESKTTGMRSACNIEGRADTLQSVDELMALSVHNTRGKSLGTVQELILDNNRQTVQYVILSSNDQLYPVPWSAFDTGTDTYTLDISTNDLRAAPMMSSLDINKLSSPEFRTQLQARYAGQIAAMMKKHESEHMTGRMADETKEMRTDSDTPQLYSANRIIGSDVKDTQSRKLGELSDVVFDVRQGNLAYGLVSFGGVLGIGDKTAAVPWESVQIQADREIATLDTDRDTLKQSVLPNGDLSGLCEPTFARQVHQGFDQEPYWEVFGFIAPSGGAAMPTLMSDATWRPESMYNKRFDAANISTMRATIKKVSTFTPEKNALPGLKLRVETGQDRSVIIYGGPQQHYLQQPIRFRKGDEITITGSQTTVNNKSVIMACEIRKGTDALMIRDLKGTPAWKMEMGTGGSMNP